MRQDYTVALDVLHQFNRAIASPPRREFEDAHAVPHVTGMVYECERRCYYTLTSRGGGGMNQQGAIRTWIGRELHAINVLGGEIELSMLWEEDGTKFLQGTLDELSPDQTLILDKKTTRYTPRDVHAHHVAQVELYNLLLTKCKGITATHGAILYINVNTTEILPIAWELDVKGMPALEQKLRERHARMTNFIAKGLLPPRTIQPWHPRQLVGTVCAYCSWYGRCWSEDFIDPRHGGRAQ